MSWPRQMKFGDKLCDRYPAIVCQCKEGECAMEKRAQSWDDYYDCVPGPRRELEQ